MPDITVSLPQDDWIKILDMIADYPFKRVAPLIQTLQQQLIPQMQQPGQPQVPQRNNGEARAPGGNN
jgi:hypothetical protein